MGTRLLEVEGVRLVINQSIVPVELESSPKDRSCLSAPISKYVQRIISLWLDYHPQQWAVLN